MNCSYCNSELKVKPFLQKKYTRHFCNKNCYHKFRKELRPKEEHERWQGGVTQTEAHRRWKKKNPVRMAHLKARRYAREKGAVGYHTFEEWCYVCYKHDWKCAICKQSKPLTKDHIVPLSEGGEDYIHNIQPLCRNCNSKKWNKIIYENPELIPK